MGAGSRSAQCWQLLMEPWQRPGAAATARDKNVFRSYGNFFNVMESQLL